MSERKFQWQRCLQNPNKNYYQWLQTSDMHWITQFHYFWQGFKSKFEINMTQGQYFKEIDYTNYLLSESYDQGKGHIVLFSRVLLEYFPCLQTCVIIHWKIIMVPVSTNCYTSTQKTYWPSIQKLLVWQHSLAVKTKLKSYVGYLTQFLILTKVNDAPLPPS